MFGLLLQYELTLLQAVLQLLLLISLVLFFQLGFGDSEFDFDEELFIQMGADWVLIYKGDGLRTELVELVV